MSSLRERLQCEVCNDMIPERCPDCHTSSIHTRKTLSPTYRCQNGHEFDSPTTFVDEVRERIYAEGGQTLRSLRIGLNIGVAPEAELTALESAGEIERRQLEGTKSEWHPIPKTERHQCEQCGDMIPESEAHTVTEEGYRELITLAFCDGCWDR